MKKLFLILVFFAVFTNKVYADNYSLGVGKILSIEKNTAVVVIFSKACHGKRKVYIKNPQVIKKSLINKVNFIMQIDKNCSKVILANPNSKSVQ